MGLKWRALGYGFCLWLLTATPLSALNTLFYPGIQLGYENYYFNTPPLPATESNYSFRSNLFGEVPLNPDGRLIVSGLYSPFTHAPNFSLDFSETFFSYGLGYKQRLAADRYLLCVRHQRWLILDNNRQQSLKREVIYYDAQAAYLLPPLQLGLKLSWIDYSVPASGINHAQSLLLSPLLGLDWALWQRWHLSGQLDWQPGYLNPYFSLSVLF